MHHPTINGEEILDIFHHFMQKEEDVHIRFCRIAGPDLVKQSICDFARDCGCALGLCAELIQSLRAGGSCD